MQQLFRRAILAFTALCLCACHETRSGRKQTTAVVPAADTMLFPAENKLAAMLRHRIDSMVQKEFVNTGHSAAILIGWKNKILYERYFGYADRQHHTIIDSATSFQLASVSKTITATAVMLLVQDGKVQLSDSLEKFFPGFPYKGRTVEQLLCHRSGLPNYIYFDRSWLPNFKTYISNNDVLRLLMQHHPAEYQRPGKRFNYSNTNYALLALIVEQASGMHFRRFIAQKIFEPCGMKNAYTYFPNISWFRRIIKSYDSRWREQANDFADGVYGDKNIYATARDLFQFHRCLCSGLLFSDGTLAEIYRPRSKEFRGIRNYGYGWRMHTSRDTATLIYHNGWWHGFNTAFHRNLRDSITIIMLSNKYSKKVYNTQPFANILGSAISDDGEEAGIRSE